MFFFFFFFFNDTATTEIYTLSLHDALPIGRRDEVGARAARKRPDAAREARSQRQDRKSTRLNSSHDQISYAVFCLKKKNTHTLDLLAGVIRNWDVFRDNNDSVSFHCAFVWISPDKLFFFF